jgi:hypothetical protein
MNASVGLSNPQRPVKAQDWEAQRSNFERLYYAEGRKLKEVMQIMADSYGFFATYVVPFLRLSLFCLAFFEVELND